MTPTIAKTRLPHTLRNRLREHCGDHLSEALRDAIHNPPADADWSSRKRDAHVSVRLDEPTQAALTQLAAATALTESEVLLRLCEAIVSEGE